mgnify:CR=1 FL=1
MRLIVRNDIVALLTDKTGEEAKRSFTRTAVEIEDSAHIVGSVTEDKIEHFSRFIVGKALIGKHRRQDRQSASGKEEGREARPQGPRQDRSRKGRQGSRRC